MSKETAPVEAARHPEAEAVVQFWREAGPKMWFAKDQAFDAEFNQRFADLHFAAARREKDAWRDSPHASLALVLLLDQFPRNCFRGSAHMFATDSLARYYAREIIDSGQIEHIDEALRSFVYVPFMHSEALEDQEYSVSLYTRFARDNLKWAVEHRDIIQRFGRFPHRNAAMGRITTAEEQAFLDDGGFAG
ncbi:DUF924 family protein [Eoetvoesiella caeni]